MRPPWPLWYVDLTIAWRVALAAIRTALAWLLMLPAAALCGVVWVYTLLIPDLGPLETWRAMRRGRSVFLATGRVRGVPASPPLPSRSDERDE